MYGVERFEQVENRCFWGSMVTLSGCGFSDVASENGVWFTAESSDTNIVRSRATVLSSAVDRLTAVVPDDAITGDVYVDANGLASSSVALPSKAPTSSLPTVTTDDTYSLYVDNALVSTMPSPARSFLVEAELGSGVHTVKLVGITAPDEVGTYGISFSCNVTVLSGPSQSGSDLTAGVVKSWQIEVSASTTAPVAAPTKNVLTLIPE